MYSRKSAGPKIQPWRTLTLTGYSCEEFPTRTTWSCLLLRKDEIRPNIWLKTLSNLSLWRRPAWQALSKALVISKATVWVAADQLKTLDILTDTTVRRSAVDWEDVKPHWKSEKSNKPINYKVFKDFTKHNIIKPVKKRQQKKQTTDRVNRIVAVEKPNKKLQVYLNPKLLNKAIKLEHLKISSTEEISQMSGASYISNLDATSECWQIIVDKQSSNLLESGNPSGRYCFKYLPYGKHSASNAFQREVI